jgi:hypothetical protein
VAAKVESDYDPKANFSQYKTFMWIKKPHMPDPLMDDRIVNAINSELTAKGWTLVPEGADVGVAAHVAPRKQHSWRHFMTDLEVDGAGIGGAVVWE